jgi:hypothetical protein
MPVAVERTVCARFPKPVEESGVVPVASERAVMTRPRIDAREPLGDVIDLAFTAIHAAERGDLAAVQRELYFQLGHAYALLGDDAEADYYFRRGRGT